MKGLSSDLIEQKTGRCVGTEGSCKPKFIPSPQTTKVALNNICYLPPQRIDKV
jgi:hypothetical protein